MLCLWASSSHIWYILFNSLLFKTDSEILPIWLWVSQVHIPLLNTMSCVDTSVQQKPPWILILSTPLVLTWITSLTLWKTEYLESLVSPRINFQTKEKVLLLRDYGNPWPFFFKILKLCLNTHNMGFPGSTDGKESACNAGDPGSILGKIPWRRDWQSSPAFLPIQFHGKTMGVAKSQTQLSN